MRFGTGHPNPTPPAHDTDVLAIGFTWRNEPGLVLPGMLARLSGELMTRALAVSIGATWSAEGGLYVRQSLELERHYDA